MLVIARKIGQTLLIGEEIEITVTAVRGDQVRLAIQAPRTITVLRKEAIEQVALGNANAVDHATGVLDLVKPAGSPVRSGPDGLDSSPWTARRNDP
jgi:carbon storage regulator